MLIPFFFVNSVTVFADEHDYFEVPYWQIASYLYWGNLGYTHNFQTTNNDTISGTITESQQRTDYMSNQYNLRCNASGSTTTCYYVNAAGSSVGMSSWSYEQPATDPVSLTISDTYFYGNKYNWSTGNYIHRTSYDSSTGVNIARNRPYYIVFLTSSNTWSSNVSNNNDNNHYASVFFAPNFGGKVNISMTTEEFGSSTDGSYLNILKVDFVESDSGRSYVKCSFDFFGLKANTNLIPIYNGTGIGLPSNYKDAFGIPTNIENTVSDINSKINSLSVEQSMTNTYITSGNSNSQAANTALNNSNTTLNNRVDQMNSIETEYNSDLNAALDDIDLSTDFVQHTGFTNAALWVSAQFNRLVIGTPFELVVTFSLITGLALVLIGKVRG